ncbi:MAG: DUF4347 domain-containing protein, partial [Magnetospirillum sp.]|nr:DUF4347 domain-containing protein [Magnetospirillum sp.]
MTWEPLALEPRVLLDAAAAVLAVAEAGHDDGASDAHHHDVAALVAAAAAPAPVAEPAPTPAPTAERIVVAIDSRLDHAAELAASFAGGTEVIMVDADRDGIALLSQRLAEGTEAASVEVYSHAGPGVLMLGSATLDAASLDGTYRDAIAGWSGHLTAEADLLLWGCSLGEGGQGQHLVERLAALTGADVAASADLTGSARLGGDWTLETGIGSIEHGSALSQEAIDGFDALLAAPTIGDSAVTTRSVLKNGDLVISGLTMGDADGDNLTLVISTTYGTLSLDAVNVAASGLTPTGGGAQYTLSGSAAAINTAITGLIFHAKPNWAGTDTLAMTLSEAFMGGAETPRNVSIVVDTQPALADSVGGTRTAVQDTNLTVTGLSVTDPDTGTITVDLTIAHGTITLSGETRLTVTGAGTGSLHIVGTAADITTALTGMVYKGTAGYYGADTIQVAVNDGYAGGTASATYNITVDAPPSVTDALAAAGARSAPAGANTYLTGLSVNDADGTATSVTVHMICSHGLLSLVSGTGGGVTVANNGTADVTLTGTVAAINAALAAANNVRYVAASDGSTSDTLTITVSDSVVTGTTTAALTISNPPAWSGSYIARTGTEDTNLTLSGLGISDADSTAITVTLSALHGTLSLVGVTGLTFTAGDGTSDATMTFSGTAAAITTAVNGLIYRGVQDYSGADTISFTSIADGQAGTAKSISVSLAGVNDAPTMTAAGATVAEGNGNTITLDNTHFSLVDVDNQDVQVIIKIASLPSLGTIYYNGGPVVVGTTFSLAELKTGVLTYAHNGTQTTVGGTADQFTVTVEDGAGASISATAIPITITPGNQAPTVSGTTTLYEGQLNKAVTVTITDADQTGAHAITITSLPADGILSLDVNANGSYDAGTDYRYAGTTGAIYSYVDVNTNGTYDVGVDTLGTATLTSTQTAAGRLLYSHDGNDTNFGNPPSTSFTVNVTDDGGGTGIAATTAGTLTLRVLANDDDPTLAANNTLNMTGMSWEKITDAMLLVADVDSPTTTLTYHVTETPDAAIGTLQRYSAGAWHILGVGDTFTQWDVNNGNVLYMVHGNAGAADAFDGTTYTYNDQFKFTVTDGETRILAPGAAGQANRAGGIYGDDTAAAALTQFTFTIVSNVTTAGSGTGGVALGPVGVGGPTVTVNPITASESQTPVIIDEAFLLTAETGVADTDLTYTITQLPDYGTLQWDNGGTWQAVTRYQTLTQADISDNKLRYVHDGLEHFTGIGFSFTVANAGGVTGEQTASITITHVNDQPSLTINSPNPTVAEGGTTVVPGSIVSMADVDVEGNTLSLTISEITSAGFLALDVNANGSYTAGTDYRFAGAADAVYSYIDVNTNGSYDAGTDTLGTADVTGAQLTAGKLLYVHDGGEVRTDTFKAKANDNTAEANQLSTERTVTIKIAPLNDAPSQSENVALTVDENGSGLIKGTNGTAGSLPRLVWIDPDNTSTQRQFKITDNVDRGTLELYTVSDSAWHLLSLGSVFSQVDLDSDYVRYTNTAHTSHSDSFGFDVRDGAASPVAGTYTINIRPANEDPSVAGPTTAFINTAAERTQTFTGGNLISVNDADYTTDLASVIDLMTVRLTANTAGVGASLHIDASTIDATGATGVQVTVGSNDSTDFTISGTKAQLNAALATLEYSYAGDPDVAMTFTVAVNDLANGGDNVDVGDTAASGAVIVVAGSDADAARTASKTITVYGSHDNDDPTIALSSATATAVEDANKTFAGGVITFADADIFTGTETVTLSVDHGTLTLATLNGLSFGAGDGTADATMTFTGTLAQVQAAVAGLVYKGTLDYNNDQGAQPVDLLTITINDGGHYGAGGGANVTDTIAITVTAVNDGPKVSTVPTDGTNPVSSILLASVTNTPLSFSGNNLFAVNDTKDTGQAGATDHLWVTVTATVAGGAWGTLTAAAGSGATVTADAASTITFDGTRAEVNAALAGMTFAPQGNDYDAKVTATITVKVEDHGNTQTGGTNLTESKSVDVLISQSNATPVVTRPATITCVEDASVSFTNSAISFTDADVFAGTETVTLSVGHGTLTLAGTTGLTFTAGDGTTDATMTFTGTMNAINTAVRTVTYTPTANWFGTGTNGNTDTLTLSIDDRGNTGPNGAADPKIGTGTVAITVTAVNDAPFASGTAAVTGSSEDAATGAAAAGDTVASLLAQGTAAYSDATDNQTGSSAPTGGTTATAAAGIAIVANAATSAQGTWEYNINDGNGWHAVARDSDAANALSNAKALILRTTDLLRFNPTGNWSGTPGALTVRVSDGDGFPNASVGATTSIAAAVGGIHGWSQYNSGTSGNGTVAITAAVAAVNDAPTIGAGGTYSATEDLTSATGVTASSLVPNYADTTDGANAAAIAGIAITANAATAAQGAWEYQIGAGVWTAVPTTGLGDGAALVLKAGDHLRFAPTGDFNGVAGGLTVRVSDQTGLAAATGVDLSTAGIGGTGHWSTATATVGITVTAVNDAPHANGIATLAATAEGAANPAGAALSTLVVANPTAGYHYDDLTDTVTVAVSGGSTAQSFAAIAVTDNAATAGQGAWQYYNGTAWVSIAT